MKKLVQNDDFVNVKIDPKVVMDLYIQNWSMISLQLFSQKFVGRFH